jgi:hypothetical protein
MGRGESKGGRRVALGRMGDGLGFCFFKSFLTPTFKPFQIQIFSQISPTIFKGFSQTLLNNFSNTF